MAGPTIDQAFIDKFNDDLHLLYSQEMTKFRGLCRTDADVKASKVRFQKLGTFDAVTKARNGQIPPSNPEHSWVDCFVSDHYTLNYVDELDLTKLNIEIRNNYARRTAEAFARKTDRIIIEALRTGATNNRGTYATSLTRNEFLEIGEHFDKNEIMDNGNIFGAVTPRMWAHMMTIPEFVDADYVGADLPWAGGRIQAKNFYGVNWFKSNLLPGAGTNQANAYVWERNCLGHAINAEVSVTWDWENTAKMWSCAGSMSMGAVVIDPVGVLELRYDDTLVLP